MASQVWQKWVELKITYRVSVIDVWDWEFTVRDWKITTWDYKITVWEIKIAIREWKNVMRDHNYQSRMKNCRVRSILTVDNEKSLCEKKKITIRDYRLVFFWAGETYPVRGLRTTHLNENLDVENKTWFLAECWLLKRKLLSWILLTIFELVLMTIWYDVERKKRVLNLKVRIYIVNIMFKMKTWMLKIKLD